MRLGLSPTAAARFMRREHGVVEDGRYRLRQGQRLGGEHVAVRQHAYPSGMLEIGRERIDLESGSGARRLARGSSPWRSAS